MKNLILILPLLLLISCNKSSDSLLSDKDQTHTSSPSSPPFVPEISAADVAVGECLNLEKLTQIMNQTGFTHPATIVTTNFKPIDALSKNRKAYYSYSALNIKQLPVNEINLLGAVTQADCKSLTMKSASGEDLEFDITKASPTELDIKLRSKFTQELPEYRQKALPKRMQPNRYVITYSSSQSLKVVTTYQSFDLICENKKPMTFESTKEISWAGGVPERFNLDPEFFENVKGAIVADVDAMALNPSAITMDQMKRITEAPMREGLNQCTQ